jgi:hypothetical protein
MSSHTHSLILGLLIGAVAVWLYDHREEIGFLSANRTKIAGAEKVWSGLREIF